MSGSISEGIANQEINKAINELRVKIAAI